MAGALGIARVEMNRSNALMLDRQTIGTCFLSLAIGFQN
jgi:hypothetical protein